jgi:photosystem II stability/assembly factor-like uncharacterized protein
MRTIRLAALIIVTTTSTRAQFILQDSHTTASLRGIHSLGNGVAWASGTEGTVLRTTDEGATWQRCATPPDTEKLDFRGIQAFDQNTAIVMSSGKGDLSRLYKTTDGCKTWKLLLTNPDKEGFWDTISFEDRSVGYILGDPVHDSFYLAMTADGGKNWRRQHNDGLKADPTAQGAFAASNSSIITKNGHLYFATGGVAGAYVFEQVEITICVDGCGDQNLDGRSNKWKATKIPVGDEKPSSGIFSLGEGAFVAVGGNYLQPDDQSASAAFRKDSIWTAAQTPPHGYRSSVAYDPTTKTWITVGPNGTDISRDDGRNWTALKPTAQDPPDADKNWNALSLPFVVGPKGRIGKLRPEALKP